MAAVPDALDHSSSSTLKDGEGACYTSLISDICYSTREDPAYFTGILQKENGHITTSESPEELGTPGPSLQEVPGMEPHGLLSSDSGIEMTPAESTEVNKILADPLDQMKAEAYKYIDITRPQETKGQEQPHPGLEDKDLDLKDKDMGVSTNLEGVSALDQPVPVEGKVIKDHLFEESTFASYIDDLSDEQHRVPLVSAPVKITLTEIEPVMTATHEAATPEKQDLCLKPSPDTVPTVTVSEPEDDSPGSVTPPSSGTGKDIGNSPLWEIPSLWTAEVPEYEGTKTSIQNACFFGSFKSHLIYWFNYHTAFSGLCPLYIGISLGFPLKSCWVFFVKCFCLYLMGRRLSTTQWKHHQSPQSRKVPLLGH